MTRVYLSLGSNLGDSSALLEEATGLVEQLIGPITARSCVVESEPWGFDSPHRFKNACLAVETTMSPLDCLRILKSIEKRMGRLKRDEKGYSDRLIDIDMLLFGDCILTTPALTLPHPHIQDRLFVLEPLVEIAPTLLHPLLGKTMQALLEALISRP